MNSKITEVIFLLDKSGSMHGLEESTIQGYEEFIDSQRKEEGTCLVTTCFFSDTLMTIHSHQDIHSIPPMKKEDYIPKGCTALYDSIGYLIKDIDGYLEGISEERNIIFVIITDGLENASRKYDAKSIQSLISQKKECEWKFLFLGSNFDIKTEAERIGLDEDDYVSYQNTETGVRKNFKAIGRAIKAERMMGFIDTGWKEEIEK